MEPLGTISPEGGRVWFVVSVFSPVVLRAGVFKTVTHVAAVKENEPDPMFQFGRADGRRLNFKHLRHVGDECERTLKTGGRMLHGYYSGLTPRWQHWSGILN
jgi:hypothetical protein